MFGKHGVSRVLIGLILGAASGVVQFWLLALFTRAVTGGGLDRRAVFLGVFQFFLPFAVLVGCAFLLRDALLWAGVGMAVSLSLLALIRYVVK